MKIKALILLLALGLVSCEVNTVSLVPDSPPTVAIGTINGLEARKPATGTLFVPASTLVDPGTGTSFNYPVRVEVTASDETMVDSIELILDGTTVGTLNPVDNPQEFRNPFTFIVPFSGNASGLVTSTLEVVATDNSDQTNDVYRATVQVDGSTPLLTFVDPPNPASGQILLSGSVTDPESRIAFDAFTGYKFSAILNGNEGEPLNVDIDGISQGTFNAVVDTTTLTNGTQRVTLTATNNANVTITKTFTFEVFNEANEPDPPAGP